MIIVVDSCTFIPVCRCYAQLVEAATGPGCYIFKPSAGWSSSFAVARDQSFCYGFCWNGTSPQMTIPCQLASLYGGGDIFQLRERFKSADWHAVIEFVARHPSHQVVLESADLLQQCLVPCNCFCSIQVRRKYEGIYCLPFGFHQERLMSDNRFLLLQDLPSFGNSMLYSCCVICSVVKNSAKIFELLHYFDGLSKDVK